MKSDDRSRIMRAVKSRHTAPELLVRSLVHKLGYRFRLHRKDLPGSPDLVFVGKKKVIFVNGCFWHGHDCARGARVPKTNRQYWVTKIARNMDRDKRVIKQLTAAGWTALIIWECETRTEPRLARRTARFLESPQNESTKPARARGRSRI